MSCPLCFGEGVVWSGDRMRAWDCACAAQGMSASGQDREAGLEAKPASPVANGDAPETKAVNPYALGGGK